MQLLALRFTCCQIVGEREHPIKQHCVERATQSSQVVRAVSAAKLIMRGYG